MNKPALWVSAFGKPKPPKPKRWIRKVSKTQARRLAFYRKVKEDHLKRFPSCKLCGDKAVEAHHSKGRVKDNLFNHLISVCRPCHDHIHANPKWAYENGFMIHR